MYKSDCCQANMEIREIQEDDDGYYTFEIYTCKKCKKECRISLKEDIKVKKINPSKSQSPLKS